MLTLWRCNISLTLLCDFFLGLQLKPVIVHCYSAYCFLLSFRGKHSSWTAIIRLFLQLLDFFWLIKHFKLHIIFTRTFNLVFSFIASRVFTVKLWFHWLFFIEFRFVLLLCGTLFREVKDRNFLVHCRRGLDIGWCIYFRRYLCRRLSLCQIP